MAENAPTLENLLGGVEPEPTKEGGLRADHTRWHYRAPVDPAAVAAALERRAEPWGDAWRLAAESIEISGLAGWIEPLVDRALKEILVGPARTDDGTQNFLGAIKTCMGSVGAKNIFELQQAERVDDAPKMADIGPDGRARTVEALSGKRNAARLCPGKSNSTHDSAGSCL